MLDGINSVLKTVAIVAGIGLVGYAAIEFGPELVGAMKSRKK
jgi:hypothetical protein